MGEPLCHRKGADTMNYIAGQTFGRLTVLYFANKGTDRHYIWHCRCECGTECDVSGSDLRSGHTQSCGCLQRERAAKTSTMLSHTHGMSKTRLYHIWDGMRYRCKSSKSKCYPHYGGRGITVCEEWQNSFEAFSAWALTHGYQDDLTIDRIDVNGNYTPENCRWATVAEQNRNKRKKRINGDEIQNVS